MTQCMFFYCCAKSEQKKKHNNVTTFKFLSTQTNCFFCRFYLFFFLSLKQQITTEKNCEAFSDGVAVQNYVVSETNWLWKCWFSFVTPPFAHIYINTKKRSCMCTLGRYICIRRRSIINENLNYKEWMSSVMWSSSTYWLQIAKKK